MTDIATAQEIFPALRDQTIDEMNESSATHVDKALGFGHLERRVKQQLVKMRHPIPFCPSVSIYAKFESVENTSLAKGALHVRLVAQLADLSGGYGLQSEQIMEKRAMEEKTAVVFVFKRVIAMRSIEIPRYSKLIPVRKKTHLDGERWLVELFGNEICTKEYYGGLANVSFTWNREANVSVSSIISEVEAVISSGKLNAGQVQKFEMSKVACCAVVKGFALPDCVGGSLTSVTGVMNLIRSLNQLPIDCAVPVGNETDSIKNIRGFPHNICVETEIRDEKKVEKMIDLLLRLHKTRQHSTSTFEFVEYMMEKFEDASMNKRSLLPEISVTIGEVVQALADHGKRVMLYQRGKEYRLHTDNCSDKSVTASASETLFWVTFGLAIPAGRHYQWRQWNNAEIWMRPHHYEACQFAKTYAIAGYYDRVKLELLFKDDELVSEWRSKIDNLFANTRKRSFVDILFGAASA
ncbi:unnamed protein product [Phytophthora lilii]|uniref:Unnamed protein product n=1 Tax=Phytophthora lilii TaxID=2077276 RepID=A0A9W6YI97_9STRA|nr:unnamed protein product [Phytophthora lilii]